MTRLYHAVLIEPAGWWNEQIHAHSAAEAKAILVRRYPRATVVRITA